MILTAFSKNSFNGYLANYHLWSNDGILLHTFFLHGYGYLCKEWFETIHYEQHPFDNSRSKRMHSDSLYPIQWVWGYVPEEAPTKFDKLTDSQMRQLKAIYFILRDTKSYHLPVEYQDNRIKKALQRKGLIYDYDMLTPKGLYTCVHYFEKDWLDYQVVLEETARLEIIEKKQKELYVQYLQENAVRVYELIKEQIPQAIIQWGFEKKYASDIDITLTYAGFDKYLYLNFQEDTIYINDSFALAAFSDYMYDLKNFETACSILINELQTFTQFKKE